MTFLCTITTELIVIVIYNETVVWKKQRNWGWHIFLCGTNDDETKQSSQKSDCLVVDSDVKLHVTDYNKVKGFLLFLEAIISLHC